MSRIGEFLYKQMSLGYSPLVLFCGGTRKGKSTTMIQLSREIYRKLEKDYEIRENFYFDVRSFVKTLLDFRKKDFDIENMTKADLEKMVRMYRCICIDEAGYELSSSSWWSAFNRALSVTIQSQAYLANCYFLALPHIKDLAPAHKRLLTVKVLCKKKGYNQWWIIVQRYHDDKVSQHEIYMGHFRVNDLPADVKKEWLLWEHENKTRIMEEVYDSLFDSEKEKETYLLDLGES